ncbi:MAG: ABC transporter ATP-binding protein [Candidatus Limivicinus sp.]|nr:ABC transporter ATP-binding protein [Candidatus Limivicinus sp.]
MQFIVQTTALTKRYAGRSVVNQVSLSVPEGSVYGFIGPNGAGKSTTMKMLLGLVKPSGGEILLLGKRMEEKNRLELLRQTGSLVESPSCYGHLTGEENLQIVAELKNVPKKDIDRVLEIVELTGCRKRKVKQYSLGMRQRLGIAQALLGNPKLLILDEPTNGLDPSGIQQMRSLIREMPQRCGATVLISSHLLSEMEQMVDQVGIINHGELLFQGKLAALRQHSQGDISLRVLRPEKALPILGNLAKSDREQGAFRLPAMREELLAELVQRLAVGQAGVVELNRHTRSLEEIFLSLTGEEAK